MAVPNLTDEQLQAARAAATRARRDRAELKRKLRDGEINLSEALGVCKNDDSLAHIRVIDLLKSLPRVGPVTAAKAMDRHAIAENRRVRGLGPNQIASLSKEFG